MTVIVILMSLNVTMGNVNRPVTSVMDMMTVETTVMKRTAHHQIRLVCLSVLWTSTFF